MSIATLASELLLRSTSNPDITTKGTELTFTEGDNNIIAIYDFLKELSSGAGLNPYNALTGYTGTVYVSFGGNIYKHIAAGPSTGITPGTNPAVWELTSIGQLVHPVNQDQYLDFGGSNQVSAVDLAEMLNNQVIQVTQADLIADLASASIVPNRIYEITDMGIAHVTVYLKSTSVRSVSTRGVAIVRIPNTTLAPAWSPTATYAVNDYISFNAFGSEVYKNLTGSNNPNTPPSSDGTNWQMQDKSVSTKYEWAYFDVDLSIDNASDTITILNTYDRFGNSTGRVTIGIDAFLNDGTKLTNIADVDSSYVAVQSLAGNVSSNVLLSASTASCIGGDGSFTSNKLYQARATFNDTLDGSFTGNTLVGCECEFDNGLNTTKTISNCRFEFTNYQLLKLRATENISGKIINEQGSNVQDTIVITGLTNVNLTANGVAHIYGEIILSSTNATESVSRFVNGARLFPIKIMPESGLTVTVNCTAYGSIGIDGQVLGSASSYTVNGSKGDYIILEPVTVGIFSVYRVKSTSLVL